MQFRDNSTARVHMNYVEKKPNRRTVLLFENGRLTFEYFKNSLRIEDFTTDTFVTKTCPEFDRNDMFISESEHFFARIENNDSAVNADLNRAFEIVKICTENE